MRALLQSLKNFFKGDNARFEEITPAFLEEQKQQRGEASYTKWLRNRYGAFIAMGVARKAKAGGLPDFWTERVRLVEREIQKMQERGFLPNWKPVAGVFT